MLPQDIYLETQRKTILVPVDTLIGTPERNSALISILQESISKDISSSDNRVNIINQFRLFYVAILSALVTLIYGANKASNQIRIYLLFFIVCIYGLEVHHNDLNYRLDNFRKVKHRDIEFLINMNPNNTTWYNVIPSDTLWNGNKDVESSARLTNEFRKLVKICQPDLDQVVIYIFPWVFLFLSKPKIKNTA